MKTKPFTIVFILAIFLSAISLSVSATPPEPFPPKVNRERIREQERLIEKATTTINTSTRIAVRDEVEKKREEFRRKLATIKKENYRNLTERLYENINRVNKNMSEAEMNHLKALESFLGKIETKNNIIQEKINLAEQKITQAEEIILSQKDKEYIIEIELEKNLGLGQDIKKTIQELKEDHRNIRQNTIRPIHDLIKEIIEELKNKNSNND